MQEIGRMLRLAREKQHLSLEMVESATKIRVRYLQAMEAGDFAVLPGEGYIPVFLRTYAVSIGLDPRPVLSHYHEICAAAQKAAEPAIAAPTRAGSSKQLVRHLFATFNGTMEWLGL